MMHFDYSEPSSLEEASSMLSDSKGKIIAGGTDILVRIKERELVVDRLVSLEKIDGLRHIHSDKTEVSIGAMATLAEIEESDLIRRCFPVLIDGVKRVGSPQIRNVATLGGNLCNAAPSADSVPPLLVLNGEVTYWSSGEVRRRKLEGFFLSPGETVLGPQDIVATIHLEVPDSRSSGRYVKLTRRKGMDIALLGIAVQVQLDRNLAVCEDIAIGLGVAAPIPIRARMAENVLKGEKITTKRVQQMADLASQEARPRDSFRSTAEYRLAMIKNLLPRVVEDAVARIRNAKEI